ncbi:MAG: helix-turn-helix transcriptional regulator [Clostridia bacterium]|nr:helix-turn-helix transcriptional regulator [Clostridia bacterium]
MDIVSKIDKLRKERKWTKSRLATEAGVCATTVYNWFNETKAIPSRETIENLCVAFKVSVASFYADVDFQDPSEQEIRLLELFRKIPDNKKDKALSALELLID